MDAAQRILARSGEVISLSPKATDILLLLLRHAGELVEKDRLMEEVWPDSYVEEGNLAQHVFTLRRALGDQRSDAQYVETLARRGYRFVAGVRLVEGLAKRETSRFVMGGPTTLAVLPFVNATGDAGLEYLADGLSEDLIKSLSQLSNLRVMSRSVVFRFKGREVDPKSFATELRVNAILLGKIISRPSELMISVELVEGKNGWLLWSDSFDLKLNEILEIEDEITRQISFSLGLNVTGEDEKRITARYTESSDAYQAYLEGRFHWSRFTRNEIETAIAHFRRAIDLDPNYALAYSGIIDCYLRLATNYLPPENDAGLNYDTREPGPRIEGQASLTNTLSYEPDQRLKLRHEWDWKGAERELRRAQDLKAEYPAANQWHAAYLFVRQLYLNLLGSSPESGSQFAIESLPLQIRSTRLTPSEEVQVFCAIAREQIVVGNFEGAKLAIERWLPKSGWPKLDHLDPHTAADLLFTLGTLIGALSLIGRISRGIKRAETYLSGSISLLEQLGSKISAAEARIELARCYYREGLFDESREVLSLALLDLPADQTELKSLCLAVYGCVDRDSGRLTESIARLREASLIETGQLVTGFRHLQLATTLKELAISEARDDYYKEAIHHFEQALYEFEAIGNHTNTAATENNFGYLLLSLGKFRESEAHLQRALSLFRTFSNDLRMAQVNETLSQLYLAIQDFPRAQEAIDKAVATLETTDGDAVLAEALITKGVISCRMKRYVEGRTNLESGYRVAERRDDSDNAVRAVVTLFEEIGDQLSDEETVELEAATSTTLATYSTCPTSSETGTGPLELRALGIEVTHNNSRT